MVQKYQSPVRVYKYPFELVMRAYEMRFPTCKEIPIVLDTEIIEEETDEGGGIHIIDRRAKLNVEAPYLLKKIIFQYQQTNIYYSYNWCDLCKIWGIKHIKIWIYTIS